jgi:hypothetical protein
MFGCNVQIICLLLMVQEPAPLPWGGSDFIQFYVANRLVLDGENPYDRTRAMALQADLGMRLPMPTFAPPWSFLPSLPFVGLPLNQAILANIIVNALLLIVCVLLWIQLLKPPSQERWMLLVIATLTWLPNLAVLGLGQLSLWPLFGFTGWLWCTRRGWRVTGSVCLVLMVIKPHLGLVLGFFALGRWYKQKDWLSLVTFTGSLIALTLVTVVFRSTIWSEYLASLQSGKAPTDFHTATLECLGRRWWGSSFTYVGVALWLAGMVAAFLAGIRSLVPGGLIACCLAIMTVPYAFSFDMVLLLPAWILALCFYFERAPGWQVALVGMIVANAWLIAGKYLPWTETAYWPVPWIVLLITWRMVSQRYAVVSSSPQE